MRFMSTDSVTKLNLGHAHSFNNKNFFFLAVLILMY